MKGNSKRFYYISCEEAQDIIAACPDAKWRLLFALARYGGLRVPSEDLQLRWGDIHWGPKQVHRDQFQDGTPRRS